MDNANHPLWSIIRLAVLMVTLITVLWLQASSFDSNEIITIVAAFVGAAAVEGAIKRITGN